MNNFIEKKPYQRIMGEVLNPREELVENGHTCPQCNSGLFDDRSILLMSNPAKYKTICTRCGYKSTRIV